MSRQPARSRETPDRDIDHGAPHPDMELVTPEVSQAKVRGKPAPKLVPEHTFATPSRPQETVVDSADAIAAQIAQQAEQNAARLASMPAEVELEEAGLRALMGNYQMQISALQLENIRLRHEAIRARQDSELLQANLRVGQARTACDSAKKLAESKLGIRLDDYHYDPEAACLRLNETPK